MLLVIFRTWTVSCKHNFPYSSLLASHFHGIFCMPHYIYRSDTVYILKCLLIIGINLPLLQNICTNKEKHYYKGPLNGTIHVVAGGGGASLSEFTTLQTAWSLYKDYDYGFVKLTAFDHSNLLFEYKKSRDGKVYDSFRISRDYRDILACSVDSCPSMTLAS